MKAFLRYAFCRCSILVSLLLIFGGAILNAISKIFLFIGVLKSKSTVSAIISQKSF